MPRASGSFRKRRVNRETQALIAATKAAEMQSRIATNRAAAIARRRAVDSGKTVVLHVPQTMRAIGERKYVDGYLDLTALHELGTNDDDWADCELNPRQQTAVYGCLPVPRQGDNYSDRDGRKITIKKIVIRGIINWTGADTITATGGRYPIARLLVVKDTKTNGVALSAEDVLGAGQGSDGQATLTADAQIMAISKPEGWGRYQIMKDKMYTRPASDVYHDGVDGSLLMRTMPFKMTLKLNTEVNFNATTGAVGSVIDNSFHLIGACSDTVGAIPQISYTCRTTFIG